MQFQPKVCMTTSISVVIPCYNCAATINRSVESVLQQSLPASEIILINDASTDHTTEIIYGIQKKIPQTVKIISLEVNGGAAHARNIGWEQATGDFIAFLDSDDTWHPEKLRIQTKFMLDNPEVSISGHSIDQAEAASSTATLGFGYSTTQILRKISLLFSNPFFTPTVMLKRKVQLRFPENQRYSEDFHLWLSFAFNNHVLGYIDQTLAFVHKPLWGHSGLSSHLLKMEQGEINNFIDLFKNRKINALLMVTATSWSILKFVKRLASLLFRKLVNI